MVRTCLSAVAGENCSAPRRQIEAKSLCASGDQTSFAFSDRIGASARKELVYVNFLAIARVERLRGLIDHRAQSFEILDIRIEVAAKTLLIRRR